MINEIELARLDAEEEYDTLGTFTTSTFMSLTNLGVDAQEFLNELEN